VFVRSFEIERVREREARGLSDERTKKSRERERRGRKEKDEFEER